MQGTDVSIPAIPPAAQRGVVVIHEIYGRQPDIDRVVDRFADAGYAAAAPDLFSDGSVPACVARVIRASATGSGRPVEQAVATRRWLCERAGITEDRVGIIGFCLGGGFVLGIGRGWGAVSANYGTIPLESRLRGIGPTIACYGGRDRAFAHFAPRLRASLTKAGVDHEVHVFPTVGHSFLTDGDHPIASRVTAPVLNIAYDRNVADEAWSKIFAFFDKHL
jgi:carboxymethylenebutenolidase